MGRPARGTWAQLTGRMGVPARGTWAQLTGRAERVGAGPSARSPPDPAPAAALPGPPCSLAQLTTAGPLPRGPRRAECSCRPAPCQIAKSRGLHVVTTCSERNVG